MKKIWGVLLVALVVITSMVGCASSTASKEKPVAASQAAVEKVDTKNAKKTIALTEKGHYTSKEQVAAYLHKYHRLPANYMTKAEARKLGWPHKGTLDKVAPGRSIGGDHFGNYDGKLPKGNGLKYTECDIDYVRGNRGAKRIVFDNKGHIYYCGDHYNTFEKLY